MSAVLSCIGAAHALFVSLEHYPSIGSGAIDTEAIDDRLRRVQHGSWSRGALPTDARPLIRGIFAPRAAIVRRMSRLRPALRWILAVTAVIVAVPIAVCLLVLAINWRDRPPSAAALDFAAAHKALPAVADRDNAYVYLLGFAAPPEEDPAVIGGARAVWIHSAGDGPLGAVGEPDPYPPPRPEAQSARGDAVRESDAALVGLLQSCGFRDARCVAALDTGREPLVASLGAERWRIERYRRLLAYAAWRDLGMNGPSSLVNPLVFVRFPHELFLLETWVLAADGDGRAVRERLDADLTFWRLVLAEADSLLSKSLAASFVRQHFEWGDLILRRLPPAARADAIPATWHQPLTAQERSMRRVLVGEWNYRTHALASFKETGWLYGRPPPNSDGLSVGERFELSLANALLQVEDSANRDAAAFGRLAPLLDAPYADLPAALARVRAAKRRGLGWLDLAYNPVGQALMPEPEHFYLARHSATIADLETLRRAVVLAVEQRARDVPPSAMADALRAGELRNPYTGEPFVWSDAERSIEFARLADQTTVVVDHGVRRSADPALVLY
jgi:hypothetical protein